MLFKTKEEARVYSRNWRLKNKWRCLTKSNISITTQRALTTETRFIFECCKRGWEICQPLDPSRPYDLLLRLNGKWQTVQVKTVENHSPGWRTDKTYERIKVTKGGSGKSYQKGDYDLLVGINLEQDKIWLIPYSDIKNITHSVTVGAPKYDMYLLN